MSGFTGFVPSSSTGSNTFPRGAVVKNSVIYDKCVIKSGVRLENVICDRSATVTADTVICGTPDSPCILPKGGVI